MPSHAEMLATDPGAAAVCGSPDKAWQRDEYWAHACPERAKALAAIQLKDVYRAAR
ncbi:hypothetical protein D3C77_714570 [compost metagenome]